MSFVLCHCPGDLDPGGPWTFTLFSTSRPPTGVSGWKYGLPSHFHRGCLISSVHLIFAVKSNRQHYTQRMMTRTAENTLHHRQRAEPHPITTSSQKCFDLSLMRSIFSAHPSPSLPPFLSSPSVSPSSLLPFHTSHPGGSSSGIILGSRRQADLH